LKIVSESNSKIFNKLGRDCIDSKERERLRALCITNIGYSVGDVFHADAFSSPVHCKWFAKQSQRLRSSHRRKAAGKIKRKRFSEIGFNDTSIVVYVLCFLIAIANVRFALHFRDCCLLAFIMSP
jgi:hypothetical protein